MNSFFTQDFLKLLRDAALELLWPTRCAGCERVGVLLCDDCRAALQRIDRLTACPCCGAPFGHLICTECYQRDGKETHEFTMALSSLELDELAGRIIVLYKDHDERRLAGVLSDLIIGDIPASWLRWAEAISWIPADRKAMRRRGFDHMLRIAREVADKTSIPAVNLLRKKPCRDQRSLNREERMNNLRESFQISLSDKNPPSRVLLLDDVCTTGATLNAASAALKAGGVSEIRVVSVARVW